mmetsp:Transcript_65241/g.147173  ORF Transcript_65241/g.147173 Transcript_65241/m.147173 type:complete len:166 (+) Transcript_65241:77-574(+)|eukprot:CAMPEP_0197893528 /NCGR_PEP_ID=MMETSP1439-20131203/32806_1 /TAXON_ID=66791 /ORGANISM="Gonyaulax spinifera, Strain CCMP409" /LENGTH=165 /DNA_ID=CAMNT_0043513799 /DNA_START=70 /DNA_END=567 /DNA_ORIENTATION=+
MHGGARELAAMSPMCGSPGPSPSRSSMAHRDSPGQPALGGWLSRDGMGSRGLEESASWLLFPSRPVALPDELRGALLLPSECETPSLATRSPSPVRLRAGSRAEREEDHATRRIRLRSRQSTTEWSLSDSDVCELLEDCSGDVDDERCLDMTDEEILLNLEMASE